MKKLEDGFLIKKSNGKYLHSNTGIYGTETGAKKALKHLQELYRRNNWGDEWENAVIVKAYIYTDEVEE